MFRRRLAHSLALGVLLAAACVSPSEDVEDAGLDLSGEWCTLGSIGADGEALQEVAFLGPRFQQRGRELEGTGQAKREGSDDLWPSRFQGSITGDRVILDVMPRFAEDSQGAPVAELELEIQGENDLVGTAIGDPGLEGEITLVRVGARCIGE